MVSVGRKIDPALADATAWVLGLLREQGIDWQPVGATENAALRLVRLSTRALEQQFTAAGRALSPEQQAEAYLLQVDARGMQLKAADLKGFQNGLATVWQLAQTPGSIWKKIWPAAMARPTFYGKCLALSASRRARSWLKMPIAMALARGSASKSGAFRGLQNAFSEPSEGVDTMPLAMAHSTPSL